MTGRQWDNDLYRHRQGRWRLTGAAGSGVSRLLLDTAAALVAEGADPSGIVLVAPSKEAASRLRSGLIERIRHLDFASSTPMVRSIHSLAFVLLQHSSPRPVRMLPGAEQDAIIRELLQGHRDIGGDIWPPAQRDAIGYQGFERALRDFLLRAGERGLRPADLINLGRTHNRPLWVAAGHFQREYEQVMELRNGGLDGTLFVSAAELTSMVVAAGISPDISFHTVLVDDAQHLDPAGARLVGELIDRSSFSVIAGDPEQSVFHFRGARSTFLLQHPTEHQLHLHHTHRHQPTSYLLVDNPSAMYGAVAAILTGAHTQQQVPWRDMCVVVRSASQIHEARRALLAEQIPVVLEATDVVLAEQPLARSILVALRSRNATSAEDIEFLATGPVGGADPVTFRTLLRGIRRVALGKGQDKPQRSIDTLRWLVSTTTSDDDVASYLEEAGILLAERERLIIYRLREVTAAANATGSVEEVLWGVWQATGLAGSLQQASVGGGLAGSQANRDLDAVMALFDAAGDFVERRPHATITQFTTHILEQTLPTGVRDRRLDAPDAVRIITAHGAVGREWEHVVIAGVHEEDWPQLTVTGSLFAQEELIDLIDDGITPGTPVSHAATRLRQEKNLFHSAITRGKTRTHIVVVDAPEADEAYEPSRFLQGLTPLPVGQGQARSNATEEDHYVRVPSLPGFVAELRRHLNHRSPIVRAQAARQLARLAQAGVAAAHPENWWGVAGPSTSEPLPVRPLSPSLVETALACPLRAVLGQLVVTTGGEERMLRGTIIHSFAEDIARGREEEDAITATLDALMAISPLPAWKHEAERHRHEETLRKLLAWLGASRATFSLIGAEVSADIETPGGLHLRGRIDRLEKTDSGAVHIIDFKTGKNPPSGKKVEQHPQLLAYQLMLRGAQLVDGQLRTAAEGTGLSIDGASLIYPATDRKSATIVSQSPQSPDALATFENQLLGASQQMRGPQIPATPNEDCRTCPLQVMCPAHASATTLTPTAPGPQEGTPA